MNNYSNAEFNVFLGGTHHSNWREEFISIMKTLNPKINCYDPVTERWTYENVVLENLVKQNSRYHVYVLSPNMVGVYSIAEMIDSAHDNNVDTFFYIKDTDIDKDGEIVNWNPRMLNSIYALNNMMIKHGAYKARSMEELAHKVNNTFNDNVNK